MIERIIFFNGKKSHKEIEIENGDCFVITDDENKQIEEKMISKIESENMKSSYHIRKDIIYDQVNTGVRSQKIYNMIAHIYNWRK